MKPFDKDLEFGLEWGIEATAAPIRILAEARQEAKAEWDSLVESLRGVDIGDSTETCPVQRMMSAEENAHDTVQEVKELFEDSYEFYRIALGTYEDGFQITS